MIPLPHYEHAEAFLVSFATTSSFQWLAPIFNEQSELSVANLATFCLPYAKGTAWTAALLPVTDGATVLAVGDNNGSVHLYNVSPDNIKGNSEAKFKKRI